MNPQGLDLEGDELNKNPRQKTWKVSDAVSLSDLRELPQILQVQEVQVHEVLLSKRRHLGRGGEVALRHRDRQWGHDLCHGEWQGIAYLRVEVGVRLIFGKVEVFRIVDAGQFALLWGKFGTK